MGQVTSVPACLRRERPKCSDYMIVLGENSRDEVDPNPKARFDESTSLIQYVSKNRVNHVCPLGVSVIGTGLCTELGSTPARGFGHRARA